MVAKSQIKFIKTLHQKKYRNLHGLFVVEGIKAVRELLDSHLEPYGIFTTDLSLVNGPSRLTHVISQTVLEQMSSLKTPNAILGVFYMPKSRPVDFDDWVLALDRIADPGNLGTIIRLCDWFGIHHLVCSQDTVDHYNPKVVQATMGSIARINILYTDLYQFLKESDRPVYGASMEGTSLYQTKFPAKGVLVMGNESHGISKKIQDLGIEPLTIPPHGHRTAESLNVASASAILLNEIRRQQ